MTAETENRIEKKLDRIHEDVGDVRERLVRVETTTDRLASHVEKQNGRVAKIERNQAASAAADAAREKAKTEIALWLKVAFLLAGGAGAGTGIQTLIGG